MTFTTRPEIQGTFGAVTSTHWLASSVGMKLLEAGGTAADAAAGTAFVLNVVEPHLNGPLGDLPVMHWAPGDDQPQVICGQGSAPAGATLDRYIGEGLTRIPGSGLLSTVVPGAFGGWMRLLAEHGRLPLRAILEPAIHYAEHGHPILPRVVDVIRGQAEFFRAEWPSAAAVWLPGDAVPEARRLFRNPDLAAFWRRLLDEAEGASGREAQIEAARRTFYEGFVAEAIDRYLTTDEVMDGTGIRRKGVMTGQDMATWKATVEPPLAGDHADWTIWKPGAWTQGPHLLMALNMAAARGLGAADPVGPDFVHQATEILKLSMADRDVYFGDPDHVEVPLDQLLSADHAAARAAQIGDVASIEQRPSELPGFDDAVAAFRARVSEDVADGAGTGGGEPTMAHLSNEEGDTVHIDVVDQWGNIVSATPSGGWLQSNPVVPGLGVPLNTRAQMFWLDPRSPSVLAPGRRPRTTLSPSMARRPDGTRVAFGTPGGDQQDQWQFIMLLRLIHHGMNLQEAIDGPLFHTLHPQGSFYPRGWEPGHLLAEPHFPMATLAALRDKGHALQVAEPWTIGRLTAAELSPDGIVRAAATPRLMQAYAVGR